MKEILAFFLLLSIFLPTSCDITNRNASPPKSTVPITLNERNVIGVSIDVGTPPKRATMALNLATNDPFFAFIFRIGTSCDNEHNYCINFAKSTTYKIPHELVGLRMTSCQYGRDLVAFPGIKPANQQMTFCTSRSDRSIESVWPMGFDGVFHLTYEYFATLSGPQEIIPDDWPKIFAIDVPKLQLHIGGYEQRDGLVWSESHTYEAPYDYQFPVFHLSMCGVDIFESLDTSFYPVKLSSLDQNLRVPKAIMDIIMNLLDAECMCDGLLECVFKNLSDVDAITLPKLTFSLSERGQQLTINLHDLVRYAKKSGSDLTVYFYVSLQDQAYLRNYLYFGTSVFRQFYTVLDLETTRVGLAQLKPTSSSGKETCRKLKCSEGKSFDFFLGRCVYPSCGEDIIQEYNPLTQGCEMKTGVKIALTTIILVFLAIDLATTQGFLYPRDLIKGKQPELFSM
eukprot:TRINITY_DN6688_c0_g1_i1.p1 TRINITY_DN6688_c0_g1~~TRINITY_DN6688_c0_g1_i1.p1  ORF type:complete len:454 (+),score=86.04 TRINITY_DN6688_c0_g1_i1:3-1364(+)